MTAAPSLADVRTLLDEATRKGYRGGVLGLRAQPRWDGPATFDHRGSAVRVVACPSALAVREALVDRSPDRWLVVVTDRDVDDLGAGVTAHLVGHRLRRPDPWEAVRAGFAATAIEPALVAGGRAVAFGLVAVTPDGGWAAARGGVLTRDHAFGQVAATRLGLGTDGVEPLQARDVLWWTRDPSAAVSLADLRADAGDALPDALLDWLADGAGATGAAIRPLLAGGRVADAVPLGIAVELVLLTPSDSVPRDRLDRDVFHGRTPADETLHGWAGESVAVARGLLSGRGADPAAANAVLTRAEAVARQELRVGERLGASLVLRGGLDARLDELGHALAAAVAPGQGAPTGAGLDGPLVDADGLAVVETAWGDVAAHHLAAATGLTQDRRLGPAHAAVRLVRWLAVPVPTAATLGELVARHLAAEAWVDRAVGEVRAGVPDGALAQALHALVEAVRRRRDAHDVAFAAALAHETESDAPARGFLPIEDVLPHLVEPLLGTGTSVLLLVCDGMSAANATRIVDAVTERAASGWFEAVPDDHVRRAAAVSVLPSLTEHSRCSLLSGELRSGGQSVERDGFGRWCASAGVRGQLFHKAELDARAPGLTLAAEVAAAVDDTSGTRLVACVLNTIDDALDRSDPGGTAWTDADVKHLQPLLDRARRAGRAVVLTADHGHVVEHREGRVLGGLPPDAMTGNRSRQAGADPRDGEVAVSGRRVLADGGRAVLLVDERARYGPLKAGYHGGASPAEVVVPVVVLVTGTEPEGWRLAPPQTPDWWRGPVPPGATPASGVAGPPPGRGGAPARGAQPATLFDEPPDERRPAAEDLVGQVLSSAIYAEQRRRNARVRLDDAAVRRVLRAVLGASDRRLGGASAAAALGVAEVHLTGAVAQLQQLLNVEGYQVLALERATGTVIVDEQLLREQFGVWS